MKVMKKTILWASVAAILVCTGLVSGARANRSSKNVQHDTLVVNTYPLCKDSIGFDGPTPLKITVVDGVVASVGALPNDETPNFFNLVLQSGLLESVVGMKPAEAAEMHLDAVSGATYSSTAVIANLRAGLRAAAEKK